MEGVKGFALPALSDLVDMSQSFTLKVRLKKPPYMLEEVKG